MVHALSSVAELRGWWLAVDANAAFVASNEQHCLAYYLGVDSDELNEALTASDLFGDGKGDKTRQQRLGLPVLSQPLKHSKQRIRFVWLGPRADGDWTPLEQLAGDAQRAAPPPPSTARMLRRGQAYIDYRPTHRCAVCFGASICISLQQRCRAQGKGGGSRGWRREGSHNHTPHVVCGSDRLHRHASCGAVYFNMTHMFMGMPKNSKTTNLPLWSGRRVLVTALNTRNIQNQSTLVVRSEGAGNSPHHPLSREPRGPTPRVSSPYSLPLAPSPALNTV